MLIELGHAPVVTCVQPLGLEATGALQTLQRLNSLSQPASNILVSFAAVMLVILHYTVCSRMLQDSSPSKKHTVQLAKSMV